MFAAEDSGSGFHPVMYEKRSDDHSGGFGNYLWAIVIVIIFLVVIFFAFAMMRRDGDNRGLGNVAEIAALGSLGPRHDNGVVAGDARAAFTEINGRFDALTQQVNHINDVNDLRDLKSTQAALSLQVADNRTDTLLNFKDLALQVSQGNCDVNRNIDNNRFENAQNTCRIISTNDANTRAILERMSADEIARLRDELAREREARTRENFASSQAIQNSYLIERLRPYPHPAFEVLPPIPATRFA